MAAMNASRTGDFMKATDFEVRHQTLLHLLVVGAAFVTYAFQRDDVVWAAVKGHSDSASLERVVFGLGAALILVSAASQTWARVHVQYPLYLARIAFALGVGLLAPVSGAVILLAGEGFLILRLLARERVGVPAVRLPVALRQESSKWGLAFTMIVFTVTLRDRLAETLAAASLLLWVALSVPDFLRPRRSKHV